MGYGLYIFMLPREKKIGFLKNYLFKNEQFEE